jgi:hypothetical protein
LFCQLSEFTVSPGQSLNFYHNHPIQFVCLAGIIVARDEYPQRTILVLDDSSGATIEIVCPKLVPPNPSTGTAATDSSTTPTTTVATSHISSITQTPINIVPLEPGTLLKVKGAPTSFRGIMQLNLERYTIPADTNAEVEFWEERTRFLVGILSVPWVLGADDVTALRKEAEMEGGIGFRVDLAGRGAYRDNKRKAEERRKRKEEREKTGRLRIERRYAREDKVREKMAKECRELSRGVGQQAQREKEGYTSRKGGK